MSKLIQKLVFFIEPDKYHLHPSGSPSTVGNLYMNRFAIDEDAGHEIVNINEARFKTHRLPSMEEKEQKGRDQIILTVNSRVC